MFFEKQPPGRCQEVVRHSPNQNILVFGRSRVILVWAGTNQGRGSFSKGRWAFQFGPES